MTAARDTDSTVPGHEHRDVSGGWLRPAVFGAMDGLVTNVSLIAGVGAGVSAGLGGASASHIIILTGLAGLAAGAFSMATGEYVSVSSQNELVAAEVRKERHELEVHPEAELAELTGTFQQWGVEPELAARVAKQVSANTDHALGVHVREELGVDPHELPSPLTAAAASLATFAVGALIPLLPTCSATTRLPPRWGWPRWPRSPAAGWWPGSPTGRSCAARCASCCSAHWRPASPT